jgi:RNA polymerase sigma factor (TIGR02999 family)
MAGSPPDVTTLLDRARNSPDEAEQREAKDRLFRLVEPVLRRLAEERLRQEWRPNPLLQPTLLLDEAFLRLVEGKHAPENRRQFFSFAARVIRQILVDFVRKAEARGGHAHRHSLDGGLDVAAPERSLDLIALDEALAELQELDPRASRVVELRFFGGLTWEAIAEEMDLALASVKRDWVFARGWLHQRMNG